MALGAGSYPEPRDSTLGDIRYEEEKNEDIEILNQLYMFDDINLDIIYSMCDKYGATDEVFTWYEYKPLERRESASEAILALSNEIKNKRRDEL